MENNELQAGDWAILAEDKKSITKGKFWAKRGEKVKVKSTDHFPVIIVEGSNESFSVNVNTLIKIK